MDLLFIRKCCIPQSKKGIVTSIQVLTFEVDLGQSSTGYHTSLRRVALKNNVCLGSNVPILVPERRWFGYRAVMMVFWARGQEAKSHIPNAEPPASFPAYRSPP